MGFTPPGQKDVYQRIADLERQVRDLQTAPQLGNSWIADGALLAGPNTDTEAARFGKLADGSYGVTGRIASQLMQAYSFDVTVTGGGTQYVPLTAGFASLYGNALVFGSYGVTLNNTGNVLYSAYVQNSDGTWIPDLADGTVVGGATAGRLADGKNQTRDSGSAITGDTFVSDWAWYPMYAPGQYRIAIQLFFTGATSAHVYGTSVVIPQ